MIEVTIIATSYLISFKKNLIKINKKLIIYVQCLCIYVNN